MKMKLSLFIISVPFLIALLLAPLGTSIYLNSQMETLDSLDLQISPRKTASQPFAWQITQVLSQESNEESRNSKIDIDVFHNIHVVWEDSESNYGIVSPNIFYKRYNPHFGFWSPPEIISFDSTDYSRYADLDTDHLGNVHIIWTEKDGSGYDILYRRWIRTSNTWSSIYNVSSPCHSFSLDSDIAIDTSGAVHIVWVDTSDYNGSGTDRDIFYRFLPFGSKIWSDIVDLSNSSYHSYHPELTVDIYNRPHVVWHELDNPDYGPDYQVIYRAVSSIPNLGDKIHVVSSESECGIGNSAHSQIAYDSESNLHFSWFQHYGGIEYDILYRTFNIGHSKWSSVYNVSAGTVGSSEFPVLAVDNSGNSHIAWQDRFDLDGAGTDYDIFYRCYNKVNFTWSDIEVVSTVADDGDNNEASGQPAIAVDTFGHVHLVWNDIEDYHGSDVDFDILYRKLGAPPLPPVLHPILPNPSPDGNITLTWNESMDVFKYYVYRDTATITTTSTLIPLAETEMSSFNDREIKNYGTYHYVIVASNFVGNSSISNCEDVEVFSYPPTSSISSHTEIGTTSTSSVSFTNVFLLILGGLYIAVKRRY